MSMFKKMAFVTSIAMLGTLLMLTTARAGDGHCQSSPAPIYSYKTVTKWVPQQMAYEARVVRYKPCGTPYIAWETRTKTVKVPITYRVKIYH